MTIHQTQCPACQHSFVITDKQLGLKNGYARCGNCKTIFSAVDNLINIAPAGSPSNQQATQPQTPTQQPQNQAPPVASPSSSPNTSQNSHGTMPQNNIDKSFPSDDAWLSDLLDEENRKEEARNHIPRDNNTTTIQVHKDTNVTAMLDEFGVDVSYEAPLEHIDYRKKIDERFNHQVSSQHSVKKPIGMTLFWSIGSVLLIIGLIVQYTIYNLNSLLSSPENASRIEKVCSLMMKCNLPVANVSMLNINTLSIAAKDANKSDVIFTLNNKTENKLIYPNLAITLRDGNNIKAQLALAPSQYLNGESYLMPTQIKPIKLRIDYPKAKFSQVNIEPFY